MEKGGWVYIMANRYRGGMYGGWPMYTNDVTTTHYKVGTGNIDVDPLFVNEAKRDYRLQALSPASTARAVPSRVNRIRRAA